MLDRLEKAGFVKRERNPDDRRSVLVRVNPAKLRKINALYAGINRQLGLFYANSRSGNPHGGEVFSAREYSSRGTPLRVRPLMNGPHRNLRCNHREAFCII